MGLEYPKSNISLSETHALRLLSVDIFTASNKSKDQKPSWLWATIVDVSLRLQECEWGLEGVTSLWRMDASDFGKDSWRVHLG